MYKLGKPQSPYITLPIENSEPLQAETLWWEWA